MVHWYVRDNDHRLTVQVNHMVKDLLLLFSLGLNCCFVTGATMFDWWSLQTNVISSVSHPRSDSVELLVMDSRLQHPGHRCYATYPLRQRQPCWEGVNISGRPYSFELWHVCLNYHVLYLHCIAMSYYL
jgi:hypothetical protein